MPIFDQSPIEFVKAVAPHLSECSCINCMKRGPDSLRNYIDNYVPQLFSDGRWDKSKPINIVDIGTGKLLQTATIVTNLIRQGYKVELSVVDPSYRILYGKEYQRAPISDDEKRLWGWPNTSEEVEQRKAELITLIQ